MERLLLANALKAKWTIGGFVGASIFLQKTVWQSHLIKNDVFGFDGNGGHILKILTNLTDEEMARLKFVRRLAWHYKGGRKQASQISDQELSDRGIKTEQEPYIEYVKRPPHDKYL